MVNVESRIDKLTAQHGSENEHATEVPGEKQSVRPGFGFPTSPWARRALALSRRSLRFTNDFLPFEILFYC